MLRSLHAVVNLVKAAALSADGSLRFEQRGGEPDYQ